MLEISRDTYRSLSPFSWTRWPCIRNRWVITTTIANISTAMPTVRPERITWIARAKVKIHQLSNPQFKSRRYRRLWMIRLNRESFIRSWTITYKTNNQFRFQSWISYRQFSKMRHSASNRVITVSFQVACACHQSPLEQIKVNRQSPRLSLVRRSTNHPWFKWYHHRPPDPCPANTSNPRQQEITWLDKDRVSVLERMFPQETAQRRPLERNKKSRIPRRTKKSLSYLPNSFWISDPPDYVAKVFCGTITLNFLKISKYLKIS